MECKEIDSFTSPVRDRAETPSTHPFKNASCRQGEGLLVNDLAPLRWWSPAPSHGRENLGVGMGAGPQETSAVTRRLGFAS